MTSSMKFDVNPMSVFSEDAQKNAKEKNMQMKKSCVSL